jgi:threonine dehydratase
MLGRASLLPLVSAMSVSPLALVREVAPPTPLEAAHGLAPAPREVLLKREDTGPNGSFKWRGALSACAAFQAAGARAIVTASTGNHGAATAWAAARLGLDAHVVVPDGASGPKCELIERHGAQLHHHGRLLDEAAAYAAALADSLGAPMFEDGACEAQLRGTETIGIELSAARADTVVVPLACGALAGGLARGLARRRSRPWIVGVQSTAFGRLGALLRGEPDPFQPSGTSFADGLADNRIVEPAFSACREHVDDVLAVDDAALRAAVRELHRVHGIVVEGAAAAPLAALMTQPDRIPGARLALVISGLNLSPELAEEILA